MITEHKIAALRKMIPVVMGALRVMHTITRAYGGLDIKSLEYIVYSRISKELEKEKPDIDTIELLLKTIVNKERKP